MSRGRITGYRELQSSVLGNHLGHITYLLLAHIPAPNCDHFRCFVLQDCFHCSVHGLDLNAWFNPFYFGISVLHNLVKIKELVRRAAWKVLAI